MEPKRVRPSRRARSAKKEILQTEQPDCDGAGWSAEINSQDEVQNISTSMHRPAHFDAYQAPQLHGERTSSWRYLAPSLGLDPHAQFPTLGYYQPPAPIYQAPSTAAQVYPSYNVPAHAFFSQINQPSNLFAQTYEAQHDSTPSTHRMSLRSRPSPSYHNLQQSYYSTQQNGGFQRDPTPAADDPAVRPLTDNELWARNYANGETSTKPNKKRHNTKALRRWDQPVPTPAYIARATVDPILSQEPKRLLVILDLNGVLVHRKPRSKTTHTKRPDMGILLDYLFANHYVMVWSSGMPANITAICNQIFTPQQHAALLGIWARDTLRLPPALFSEKVQVYKQLSWVWEDQAIRAKAAPPGLATHEEPAPMFDQSNTVLIDDSVEKAVSEPHNLIEVDEFEAHAHEMRGTVLAQVVDYLDKAKWAEDVSAWMRKHPFVFSK